MVDIQNKGFVQMGFGSGEKLFGNVKIRDLITTDHRLKTFLSEKNISEVKDDYYLATRFIILFYVPLIPIKTYLVISKDVEKTVDAGIINTQCYNLIPYNRIYWPQVFRTYGKVLLIVLALFSVATIWGLIAYYIR